MAKQTTTTLNICNEQQMSMMKMEWSCENVYRNCLVCVSFRFKWNTKRKGDGGWQARKNLDEDDFLCWRSTAFVCCIEMRNLSRTLSVLQRCRLYVAEPFHYNNSFRVLNAIAAYFIRYSCPWLLKPLLCYTHFLWLLSACNLFRVKYMCM